MRRDQFPHFLVCGKLVPSRRQAFVVNLSRLERTCPGFIEVELASGTSGGEFRQRYSSRLSAAIKRKLARCNALERDRNPIGKDVS
jgi:hypothetical protein